eukprot:9828747-Lingulodinium_polyedra.AAC.1
MARKTSPLCMGILPSQRGAANTMVQMAGQRCVAKTNWARALRKRRPGLPMARGKSAEMPSMPSRP